jgi:hypothetical protein
LLPAQARQVRRVRVIDDLAFFSGAGNDATDLLVLKNPAQGKARHAYAGRDRLPDLLDRFQGNVTIHSGQSERENPARWLTWLRRLRTANVERVEAGVRMASEDHEFAPGARIWRGGVSCLNGIFRLPSVGVMNL